MLHPTRLSLSMSGATPQAAQPPRMGENSLEGVYWYTSRRCILVGSWELPCGGAEGVRWLLVALASSHATGSLLR
jgi:hypothetical protein